MKKIHDIEFIQGVATESFHVSLNNAEATYSYYFEIKKGDEKRIYEPERYLQLILDAYYEKADTTKKYRKQLVALANAESKITRLIIEHGLKRYKLNFSDIFTDIDVTRRRLNAYIAVNERRNDRLITIGAVCIGSILTALLSHYLLQSPHPVQTTILIPKTDTVYKTKHDTIWIEKNKK